MFKKDGRSSLLSDADRSDDVSEEDAEFERELAARRTTPRGRVSFTPSASAISSPLRFFKPSKRITEDDVPLNDQSEADNEDRRNARIGYAEYIDYDRAEERESGLSGLATARTGASSVDEDTRARRARTHIRANTLPNLHANGNGTGANRLDITGIGSDGSINDNDESKQIDGFIPTNDAERKNADEAAKSRRKNSRIDLDTLESTEYLHGEYGPLLIDYQKSTSTIRKDYTTVDWYFTKHNLGRIRRMIRLTNKAKGWKGKLMNAFIAGQAWIILFFVGIATAVSASFIHIVCEWLIDIKEGYCKDSFFSNKRICCIDNLTHCPWKQYDEVFITDASQTTAYWFNYFFYFLLAVPTATLSAYLVYVFSHAAARSGLSELKVMLGGFIIKKFLGVRTLVIKSIGLILAVSSGVSIGKLGPLVHIACCWGNIFSRQFTKYNTNEVKKREILSASVAAGVSAAFGAPIGGVLFSLESVSSYFPPQTMWRSFWCSITAALVLQWIDPFQTGKLVQFAVASNANQWNWHELPIFAALGCSGGLIGAAFIKLNLKMNQFRLTNRWLRLHPVSEVAIIAAVTAIVNYSNVYMRGSNSALLAQLFTNCQDVTASGASFDISTTDNVNKVLCQQKDNVAWSICELLITMLVKFILTIITYGCAVPGGAFMPALVIGASMGRIVGWGVDIQHTNIGDNSFFSTCAGKTNCVSPGLYAIIGAAATLTGITRLTVSLTIIIFEVTGGLDYIVPIMISIVCGKWVADAFGRQGLYPTRILQLHGYPWIDAYAEMELIGPAMDIMSKTMVCLTVYGETMDSLKKTLATYPYHGFPIIDNSEEMSMYGYIARSDLEIAMEEHTLEAASNQFIPVHFSHDPPPYQTPNFLDFSPSVDKHPIKVLPHTPIDRVLGLFQGLGLRYVLVMSHKGTLLGLIKKKDLLLYIRQHKGDDTSTV